MTTNILLTGAGGQLGQEFTKLANQFPSLHITAYDRHQLDITQPSSIDKAFKEKNWDYCINCAAYTAVDRAESEPKLAMAINCNGAENLARACRQYDAFLIHFSTDYVYHNQINRPLLENDPTTPKGVYAQSKLAGEEAILSVLPEALIMRTSWVYSSFGHNFVKTMLKLGKEKDSLRIVFDQIGTPTYAQDIAAACLNIIKQQNAGSTIRQSGVFNFSNEGVCSWYDFAWTIFELRQIPCTVYPIESKDYPTPALRPPYSVLNKNKFKSAFHFTIPYWRDGLIRCLQKL